MNRDELRTRPTALPPRIFESGDHRVLYPSEPTGGTWIAVNDTGVCLALLNWHRINRLPLGDVISRGEVVRALVESDSIEEISARLKSLMLDRIRPFRLIVCVPRRSLIAEYGWNLKELKGQNHDWNPHHWFSSGYDEKQAEFERAQVCQVAWRQPSAGSLEWLRDLHCSHLPERGPFSICMHETRAETVSYTEVNVTNASVTMRYQPGSPCGRARIYDETLAMGT